MRRRGGGVGVLSAGQGVGGGQGAAQGQRGEETALAGVRAVVHGLSSPVVASWARGVGLVPGEAVMAGTGTGQAVGSRAVLSV